MTTQVRVRQAWTIAKLELGRTFFSRRSFWVYLLALMPVVLFLGHGIDVKLKERRWAGARRITPAIAESIQRGEPVAQVLARTGEPLRDREWHRRRGENETESRYLMFYDGEHQVDVWCENDVVRERHIQPVVNVEEDRKVFAGVFDFFYLRLAIFFGCLGIFMNRFRGEMLDKTLHYWLVAPVRREVLLAGKYLAGLIAATLIFTVGVLLCFAAMLWPMPAAEVRAYLNGPGVSHALWYAAAGALACVGYGSVFLAAGLLLKNPIVPAAVILLWESINGFLPTILQKLSVLYYVQALCPLPVPVDANAPVLVRMIFAPAAPPSRLVAVLGLLGVTALVLWSASWAVRRLEIDYSTD
jgi:hypothetical protein